MESRAGQAEAERPGCALDGEVLQGEAGSAGQNRDVTPVAHPQAAGIVG